MDCKKFQKLMNLVVGIRVDNIPRRDDVEDFKQFFEKNIDSIREYLVWMNRKILPTKFYLFAIDKDGVDTLMIYLKELGSNKEYIFFASDGRGISNEGVYTRINNTLVLDEMLTNYKSLKAKFKRRLDTVEFLIDY